MGLFRRGRRAQTVKPADPGMVGAAATPAAHTATATHIEQRAHRDQITQEPRDTVLPGYAHRWRAPGTMAATPAGPMSDDMGAVPARHTGTGSPDPRRVWDSGPMGAAGYPLPKNEAFYPEPETLIQQRIPVVIGGQHAPARVRGGSTGDDATRTSILPLWLFFRRMEVAEPSFGSTGVSKIEEASPLASVPILDTHDVHGGVPSAGGWRAASGMRPSGIQPNTVRLIPRSWDELAIITATNPTPETTRRANGWKAGG
jgi:hypothetical protein